MSEPTWEGLTEIYELLLTGDSRSIALFEVRFRKRILKRLFQAGVSSREYDMIFPRIFLGILLSTEKLDGPESLCRGVDTVTRKTIKSHLSIDLRWRKSSDDQSEKSSSLIDSILADPVPGPTKEEIETLLNDLRQAMTQEPLPAR